MEGRASSRPMHWFGRVHSNRVHDGAWPSKDAWDVTCEWCAKHLTLEGRALSRPLRMFRASIQIRGHDEAWPSRAKDGHGRFR